MKILQTPKMPKFRYLKFVLLFEFEISKNLDIYKKN